MINHLPSGLAVVNRNLELEWSNTGFRDMFGSPLDEAAPGEIPGFVRKAVADLIKISQLNQYQVLVLKDTDLPVDLEESRYYMVFLSSLGETGRFLLDIRDYSQRRAEERKNAQRDRLAAIGELSIGIAHEINNPNAYIRLNASNLKSIFDLLSPTYKEVVAVNPDRKAGNLPIRELVSRVPHCIEAIEKGAGRIVRVVETLKSFGRREEAPHTVVDLHEVADQALEMALYLSKEVADLAVEVAPDLPKVGGSSLDLELVIINLISNAWDSVRKKREVSGEGFRGSIRLGLSTREDRQVVVISVSDNGIGIEPDNRAKVFSPFFTTKPQGQGTGLGLALTHRIVQRHGGNISFESQPRKGAAFTVELPALGSTGLPLEDAT